MANHKRHAQPATLSLPSKSQLVKIAATVAAVGLLATGGFVSHNLYATADASKEKPQSVSAYSVSDANEASRGNAREALKGNTSYVTVKINGKTRVVPGTDFTDVKSVLDAGDITLDPEDTVSPALTTKVNEKTVITINRAGASVAVTDTAIPFNTVKKETSSLPKGQEKVETEGQEGVMETTNLVTKSGGKVVSSNMISSFVKKAPTDKVILVGTGSTTPSTAAATIGTTVPAGEMQQWAHDYLLSNGYTEEDFTATVYIISHESGWNVSATNPSSGAYGLPQALPGSKMVSAGADWATNYQTQLKWFWGYCAQRYGSIQGAYAYWLAHKSY
ncbi:G5 domain-containing protein [Bifidobacterium ruminantium]|uniref:G5 domain protein n=1 Tax=Bifidobacterium ruminantium TaxID=78346 RepID=A0A087D5G6_BIFRU|nr:G5 domain-containing protein [Bifidobacterium ruminantium]KFI90766.1 G5 domain protein [Bifidobacterium ruminantium]MEE0972019.1 G5 domain-containing protein [Bifidobacterium ruminantium]